MGVAQQVQGYAPPGPSTRGWRADWGGRSPITVPQPSLCCSSSRPSLLLLLSPHAWSRGPTATSFLGILAPGLRAPRLGTSREMAVGEVRVSGVKIPQINSCCSPHLWLPGPPSQQPPTSPCFLSFPFCCRSSQSQPAATSLPFRLLAFCCFLIFSGRKTEGSDLWPRS